MTFTRVFYVPGSAALEALVPIGRMTPSPENTPCATVCRLSAAAPAQLIHEGAPFGKAALLEEELDFGVAAALST